MTTATPMQTASQSFSMRLLQQDRVPDWLIRARIRKLLEARLASEDKGDPEKQQQHLMQLIGKLNMSPVAINIADANEQHYELPTAFFQAVLGEHLKYSSCYYDSPADTLDVAEARMLALTCVRARLVDGERILELGCGWGSKSRSSGKHVKSRT